MVVAPSDAFHASYADEPTVSGGLTSAIAPAGSVLAQAGASALVGTAAGLSVRIVEPGDLAGVIGAPTKAWDGPTATHVINDAGSGTFKTGLDDADLSSIQFGRLFQVVQDGTVRWTGQIEHQTRERVTDGEESAEVVTVAGRQIVSMLESAVTYPEGGAGLSQFNDTRFFNFANPSYDDSAWVAPKAIARQGQNPNAISQYSPPYQDRLLPEQWYAFTGGDPDAWWIGPPSGAWDDAPAGTWYLRGDLPTLVAGDYRISFAMDNAGWLYLDGVQIAELGLSDGIETYTKTHTIDVSLAAGSNHVIAAKVRNFPKSSNNPTNVIVSVALLDGDTINGYVFSTDTSSNWRVLDFPTTTPGMTVGEVMGLLLTEAQSRGALPGWVDTFSNTVDTASTAWPTEAEIAVTVGSDMLSVLRQFSAAYIDFRARDTSLTLVAWVAGGRGSASGVAYTKGTSLTELTVQGEG